jgi:hypothetical protein
MNDTFSFHAPAEVFRRRLDPRWVRLGVIAALLLAATASFGRWVVASERAADLRREAALAALQRPVASVAPAPIENGDVAAKAAASTALTVARDVFAETGSFSDASTAALAEEQPDLIFVDGPSAAPAIVSVQARDHAWSAAVMGEAACLWIKVTADGVIRYGDGAECTGAAAAAADRVAW